MENNQMMVAEKPTSLFSNIESFEAGQRMALVLNSSALVPKEFRGKENLANAVIALEMAQRLEASPLAVMQNMYIVHGKPSWSASFIIAAINSCGRFLPLRFEITGDGDDKTCIAWTLEIKNGEDRLESPPVSICMAKKEGWYGKNGSKWQTMPELMLRYRAATFFGRLYAPEILMGMRSAEELQDAPPIEDPAIGETARTTVEELNKRFPGKEVIDTNTGEINQPDKPQNETPPVNPEPEQKEEEKPPRVMPRPANVKKFKAEIDEKQTDDAVNEWVSKHWKRVENDCPHKDDQEEIRRYATERIEALRPAKESAADQEEEQMADEPERSDIYLEMVKELESAGTSSIAIDQWCMNNQTRAMNSLSPDEVDALFAHGENLRQQFKA